MAPYANKTLHFCEYNPIAFIVPSLNFYFKHEIQLTKALSGALWRGYLQSAMFG